MTEPRRTLPLLVAATLVLGLAGCGPRSDAIDRTDYSASDDEWLANSEDRSREMEAMADDMNADLRDAMEDAESEQDLERAYQQFEASRQELNEMSDSDEYAPEP